jgi:hypothetical protein
VRDEIDEMGHVDVLHASTFSWCSNLYDLTEIVRDEEMLEEV